MQLTCSLKRAWSTGIARKAKNRYPRRGKALRRSQPKNTNYEQRRLREQDIFREEERDNSEKGGFKEEAVWRRAGYKKMADGRDSSNKWYWKSCLVTNRGSS